MRITAWSSYVCPSYLRAVHAFRCRRRMTRISAERIAAIGARRDELQNAMSAPDLAPEQFVRLSKDYAEIEPAAAAAGEVRRLRAELEALSGMADDPEMREMVAEEAEAIRKRVPEAIGRAHV